MSFISSVSPPLRAAAEGFSLALSIVHRVALFSDHDPVFSVNGRLPESIDVLSNSDITFSLCGSLNRVQALPEELQKSAFVHFLLRYLTMARFLVFISIFF